MKENKKKRRKLKKNVKITGLALLFGLSGFTLITSIKHFMPPKNEIKQEQNDDSDNEFITANILENAINNYYSISENGYSYILKNKNESSYIISNDPFFDSDWEIINIENNNDVFQEIVDLDYNQIASYLVQEQQLLVKDDSDSVTWRKTVEIRIVSEAVPAVVFEGEDRCWHIINKKMVIDDKYNIFEFMQVYKGSDGSLFIGVNEPSIVHDIYWEYVSSLTDFIEKNKIINNVK